MKKQSFDTLIQRTELLDEMRQSLTSDNDTSEYLESFMEAIHDDTRGPGYRPPVYGVDYFTEDEQKEFAKRVLEHATPKRGVHYFTEQEVEDIVQRVVKIAIVAATPIKGVHYFDGKDGKDGTNGTNGKDAVGIPGAPGRDGKDAVMPDLDEFADSIIAKIRKDKKLLMSDLRDGQVFGYNKRDQRWHGAGSGGASVANETFTTTGGAEAFTLEQDFGVIISVVVNGQSLNSTAGYTASGSTVTLVDANTPAGLAVNIVYTYTPTT